MAKIDLLTAELSFLERHGRLPEGSERQMCQQLLTAVFWLLPESSCRMWFSTYQEHIIPDSPGRFI